jgi:hypothetical protein
MVEFILEITKMNNTTRTNKAEAEVDTKYGEKHCNGPRADVDMDDFGVTISSDGWVRWNDNSPDHPRNWKPSRKFYDIGVVAMMEFFT